MRKLKSESSILRLVRAAGGKKIPADGGERSSIGVLAFEVASLMSKTVHLWNSLSDEQIARLRDDVLCQEGVRKLVSDDDDFLLGLALAEMADSLHFLSRSVSRLGKRCSDPVLQRFEQLFADLVKSGSDLYGMQYAGRKMERKVKKMERLVAATSNLYQELEVLAELEQGLARAQSSSQGSVVMDCKQKVIWQRQEVKYIRSNSLWNRTYDYTVRLLGRSLFTIVARIKLVFGFEQKSPAVLSHSRHSTDQRAMKRLSRSQSHVLTADSSSVHPSDCNYSGGIPRFSSGPLITRSGPIPSSKDTATKFNPESQRRPHPSRRSHDLKTKWGVTGRPFIGCMAGGHQSPVMQSCVPLDTAHHQSITTPPTLQNPTEGDFSNPKLIISLPIFDSTNKFVNPPDSTLGAAALALHYANVIIVIEKLAVSPHLISPDAREDLYNMLTASIRASLRAKLKAYSKNLASSVYDPALATEWTEAIGRILDWLGPLAHNMIRWQSNRNFEQRHVVSSTNNNVLLLQTLYFANQAKTEAAITELLVGLNYLWRYGRELNAKAMLACISGRDYDDCFSAA